MFEDVRRKHQAYIEAERAYDALTTPDEKAAQTELIKALYAEYQAARAKAESDRADFQKR